MINSVDGGRSYNSFINCQFMCVNFCIIKYAGVLHTERKDMSTKFFKQEYRGFNITQVVWSHPEIGENLKHFTMEEIDGRWAGHTIGAKMSVPQCEKFIDQLIEWRESNLKVGAVG